MPKLFLIPSQLSDDGMDHIPPIVVETIGQLEIFVVEGLRSARRYIRKLRPGFDIDGSTFVEMDKHDPEMTRQDMLTLFELKKDIGLLSEAGSPCLADPGNLIVDLASSAGYKIVPLTGPTSIVLGLVASGCNGQQFTFHGYLPIKEKALIQKLKSLERDFSKTGYTQIWIETPYRNDKMLRMIIKTLSPDLRLAIACDITAETEEIGKMKIQDWRGIELGKRPAIFILG